MQDMQSCQRVNLQFKEHQENTQHNYMWNDSCTHVKLEGCGYVLQTCSSSIKNGYEFAENMKTIPLKSKSDFQENFISHGCTWKSLVYSRISPNTAAVSQTPRSAVRNCRHMPAAWSFWCYMKISISLYSHSFWYYNTVSKSSLKCRYFCLQKHGNRGSTNFMEDIPLYSVLKNDPL